MTSSIVFYLLYVMHKKLRSYMNNTAMQRHKHETNI